MAPTTDEFSRRAMTAIADLAGPGDAIVIGAPSQLPMRDAALINGMLIDGLDFYDPHKTAASFMRPAAFFRPSSSSGHAGANAAVFKLAGAR